MKRDHVSSFADSNATLFWTSKQLQAIGFLTYSITLCVTIVIVGRRATMYQHVISNPQPTKSTWICDVSLLISLSMSLIFVIISGFFQYGLGLNNPTTCRSAILICVIVYTLVKVFFYFWLLERLWIVQCISTTGRAGLKLRLTSKIYTFGAALYLLGVPAIISFGIGNEHDMRNGFCHIGIGVRASIAVLVWDMCINIYLSSAFAIPLFRSGVLEFKSDLRSTTITSLVCALVGFASSFTNFVITVSLHAPLAPICFMCCSIDILVNTVTLGLTTKNRRDISTTDIEVTTPSPFTTTTNGRNLQDGAQLAIHGVNFSKDVSNSNQKALGKWSTKSNPNSNFKKSSTSFDVTSGIRIVSEARITVDEMSEVEIDLEKEGHQYTYFKPVQHNKSFNQLELDHDRDIPM